MQTNKINSKKSHTLGELFLGAAIPVPYLWKNLIAKEQTSTNWLHELNKGNILHNFWLVLSSPIS